MAQGQELDGHQLREMIAQEVGVPLRDVEMMQGRLSGSDFSLNATQSSEDEGREWIEALEDDDDVQRVTTNFEASDEVMAQL